MPILKNAKKALRVSNRKAAIRQPAKSRVKTMIDAVKKEPTAGSLSKAFSAIDRAAKINVFHKKKAAHLKSQLARLLGMAPTKEVKTAKPAAKKSAK